MSNHMQKFVQISGLGGFLVDTCFPSPCQASEALHSCAVEADEETLEEVIDAFADHQDWDLGTSDCLFLKTKRANSKK